jgi:orotidine-5'-phosphate decarboxylase
VPGVGSQGGNLKEVSEYGMNKDCGLLVNISRSIIYASGDVHFAEKAGIISHQYQQEMEQYLFRLKPQAKAQR